MLTNPIDHLAQITDPRRQNKNLLHPLRNILTIALSAVICGYLDWVDIEDFGNENKAWFAQFLDLTNGIPSHDTFGNVFKRLNQDELSQHFSQWINDTKLTHPTSPLTANLSKVGIEAKMRCNWLPPLPVKPNWYSLNSTSPTKLTKSPPCHSY